MRQLMVKVPEGEGKDILDLAEKFNGANLVQMKASDTEGDWDFVIINIGNRQVGPLLDELGSFSNVKVTLIPSGVYPMSPPESVVPDYITDVEELSPTEVWLHGKQSVGSWKGFLGYSAAAGIVVWIGMFTNTIYLLVAAMILAPFAGPAMNVAIATSTGDKNLLGRNLLRYFISLAVTIFICAMLSLVLQQKVATETMVNVSQVSAIAVLLPLTAGAAGALNLVQSENNSLVSGTAVGFLVAASLAPPAGLIGMAAGTGRWDMIQNGLFVLLLQLVGINLAGTLVFRAFGLRSVGARYERGEQIYFFISTVSSAILLAALLVWQFTVSPGLQRASVSQRAVAEVQAVIEQNELVSLVEANLRFTRPSLEDQEVLLGVIYLQREPGVVISNEEIQQELNRAIQNRLLAQGYDVTPVMDISVLDAPLERQ